MSFFSWFKRNKEDFSLVFSIGGGVVSGAIVKVTEKDGVELIHHLHEDIEFQAELSATRHFELMQKALDSVAKRLKIEGFRILKTNFAIKEYIFHRAFYIFSSPWAVSQTKIIKVSEPKPFRVSREFFDRKMSVLENNFKTEISSAEQIIEKKIIQVKLNGYVVEDFYDKTAQNMEVAFSISAVPKTVLKRVEDIIVKSFSIKEHWCHSSSLALFTIIRNLFPQREDFIMMNVGEEITDIVIIKNNIVVTEISIPFGRRHFLRLLSDTLKVTESIAESMIKIRHSGTQDELATLRLSVAMDAAAKDWLFRVTESIEAERSKYYVPDDIFLIVPKELINFLSEKLKRHSFRIWSLQNKKIKSSIEVTDQVFRLELMFLDNLYKI